jgi:hypothetical protein
MLHLLLLRRRVLHLRPRRTCTIVIVVRVSDINNLLLMLLLLLTILSPKTVSTQRGG